jgi:adenosine deaminase
MGIPISLSSDDPARFGYNSCTPDHYVAAHAFGFDLKDFKLLGIYSILYAACGDDLKKKMLTLFKEDWQKFMHNFKDNYIT